MIKKLPYAILYLICIIFSCKASAQKVLQIETSGKAQTTKLFIGQTLTFQIHDLDYPDWQTAVIEDLLVEDSLVLFGPRYIHIKNIKAFKFDRGWTQAANKSLLTFGAGWSGFAFVGTLTDGNPDTNYRWSDALVSGTSILLATAIPAFFGTKKIKFGKRKRLRLLDLRPN